MSVEVVIHNVTPGCGEGPVWEENSQRLVFVDTEKKTVLRWDSVTRNLETIQLDDIVSCIVPCKNGGYLVGVERQVAHLHWSTGKLTKLHEIPLNGIQNGINDGKCDPAGRFWIGSMGRLLSYNPVKVDLEKGELYCLDTDGSFHKHVDKLNLSNGMAWRSNHKVMYLVDSVPGQIMAFDYDITSGKISNRRTVLDCRSLNVTGSDNTCIPDGMTIDTNRNLWVAFYGGGLVVCFNPETGEILRKVEMPCKRITSCCFGGKNLDELYVTSGREGATDEEIRNFPATGSLFRVTGLGVKGLPANVYQGNC